MKRAAYQNRLLGLQQPLKREVDAYGEKQRYNADFGKDFDLVDCAYQSQSVRTYENAREEESYDRR